jgi:protease-4
MLRQQAGILSDLGDFLFNWFTIAVFMAALGVAAGLLIFVFVFPGQPKIGVIDIPFTVIEDNSTYVINEYINYARRDDSIKAVVIRLSSPGGGAASSERLYIETRKLAEEKPVVLVMNGLVASGGYMMAMGATHTYAQTSSLVGNVGVVAFSGPLIPPNLAESVIATGPYKIDGFSRGEWFGIIDELKDSFAQIVVSERGEELRISKDELAQGRLYSGLRAVQLGLVDELGGDSDAFEKAAELSHISNYSLVDVNLEVMKQFVKDFEDVQPESGDASASADALALIDRNYVGSDPSLQPSGIEPNSGQERFEALRSLMLYGRLGVRQEDPLPDFPMELDHPNVYYLYVGNAR